MHQDRLVSPDLQEELDHQAQLVHWERPDPWDLQEKKVHVDSAEIMDPLEDKERGDHQDQRGAPETKGTLERTAQRVLMVLQVQLELQG